MSQTHDQRVETTMRASGQPVNLAEAQDPSELLSLLDGASSEAMLLAQGLTGNAFALGQMTASAELDGQGGGGGDSLLQTAAQIGGSVLGSTMGGAFFGLPGAVLGGLAGSALAASMFGEPGAEEQQAPVVEATQDAAEETTVATETPTLDATPLATKDQTRDALIASYQTWLEARTAELADLSGDEKARRIEGLLDQAGRVYAQLEQDQMVDVDQLDAAPSSQGATHVAGTAPPELIGPMRALISQIEVDIDGATADEDATAETSRTSGVDWNSRLGVPQYRNQNDNAVASFVTCNVTSGAMIMERLGYGRDDIKAATERELTEAWLTEQKAAWKTANGSDMPTEQVEALRAQGPGDDWVTGRIAAYFEAAEAEAANGSDYRQMRSGKDADLTGADHKDAREAMAAQFMDDAQGEELLDLLMQLHYDNGGFSEFGAGADLGAVRRSIATEGVADELLALIDPTTAKAGTRDGCEQLSGSWADAKPKIKACLKSGGAAQMSVMHKAQKDEGHLVSVQQITAAGVVIDDPYGRIGADYDHDETTAGTSAYKSGVSGASNAVDADTPGVVDDDWTWQQGQELSASEQRGMSRTLPDSQISTMFKYVTLYHRPGNAT